LSRFSCLSTGGCVVDNICDEKRAPPPPTSYKINATVCTAVGGGCLAALELPVFLPRTKLHAPSFQQPCRPRQVGRVRICDLAPGTYGLTLNLNLLHTHTSNTLNAHWPLQDIVSLRGFILHNNILCKHPLYCAIYCTILLLITTPA